jgi:hypothetical protein
MNGWHPLPAKILLTGHGRSVSFFEGEVMIPRHEGNWETDSNIKDPQNMEKNATERGKVERFNYEHLYEIGLECANVISRSHLFKHDHGHPCHDCSNHIEGADDCYPEPCRIMISWMLLKLVKELEQ